ncbi:MAG: succinylglutamate desuccinylase/aspartoacylase family protein [Candidatus Promineifilaceae bacterium]|nr:succinylglutamate desuccinylase/aspartoacylase family protein [Candidatus Promineifilaceae bacterium]
MTAERSPIQTDLDYERDGKQITHLRVPHSRNTSAWGKILIPIVVIKNGPGPTALLVGGNHGGEYEGPVSLLKLARALQPDQVRGRVILLPALNLPAVLAGQRVSPIDGRDMNRSFPGQWNGTLSQVIAHYVHEVILPLCDAVLDLHSGGYSLDLYPFISMHYLPDEAQTAATRAALEAFQAPVGLIAREFTGEGLLDYAVERLGKIFLFTEMGGAGRLRPHTLSITEVGVHNFLKHLGIISGEIVDCPARGLPPMRLMETPDADYYHTVLVDGIYEPFHELGQWVEAGQPLGQVHFVQFPSRAPRQVTAQRTGMLLGTRGPGFVEVGDTVALVARDLADGL